MSSIAQVACEAGVSPTTASFVLNGRAEEMRISQACADRVVAAAQKLSYRGNYHARTLVHGRAMTLALVNPYNQGDVFRLAVTTGMMRAAREHGYEVLNIGGTDGEACVRRGLRYVQERRVDGLVIFQRLPTVTPPPGGPHDPLPLIHIWFDADEVRPVVTIDPAPGIRQAVEHLAELGHRRVLWLGAQVQQEPGMRDRLVAFRQRADQLDVERVEKVVPLDAARPGGADVATWHTALNALGDLPGECTAIMCYNDRMAIAAEMVLAARGIRIPDDVSVVGFDDLQADMGVPPLTTVSHILVEMGARATETVLAMVDEPELCAQMADAVVRVPAELIVRDSTGPAGQDAAEKTQ